LGLNKAKTEIEREWEKEIAKSTPPFHIHAHRDKVVF